jgi:hypothetical protein
MSPAAPKSDPNVGNSEIESSHEIKPPLFRSWARLYAFVLGELVILIVLFYAFSKHFQ